jgi:U3 small nucleolar ribonucleoprotein protein LCP5
MALETSLPALLETLTQSLSAASQTAEKIPSLFPPQDGISLLDTKNELFLSYLQNLVFLILLKVRNRNVSSYSEDAEALDTLVVKKLVELTTYIERGVLNLEGKLKYQIDKVLRAAQDAENAAKINAKSNASRGIRKVNGEDQSADEDEESESDEESADGGVALKASEIDDLQYRPNPLALQRPFFAGADPIIKEPEDGLYKPPRITATAMPTTERREKEAGKPNKSATLDEFISSELSMAPLAEPSIGSGIIEGGRRSKSEKERKEEKERREYEERNYVRLPKETKKDRAKKGGRKDAGYGGEEWRGLGEGIDRIERLTKRKGGESRSVLEKSRKRSTEDGPRGDGGAEVGQSFQKRLKTLNGGRRDRGRAKQA